VKKPLGFRWKQINRFETHVKNLGEAQNSWRRRYNIKEGDLKAAKVHILFIPPFSGSQIDAVCVLKTSSVELAFQISWLKRSPVVESFHDILALTARATQTERRATVGQNQLEE
jgi:hypothetical protein